MYLRIYFHETSTWNIFMHVEQLYLLYFWSWFHKRNAYNYENNIVDYNLKRHVHAISYYAMFMFRLILNSISWIVSGFLGFRTQKGKTES